MKIGILNLKLNIRPGKQKRYVGCTVFSAFGKDRWQPDYGRKRNGNKNLRSYSGKTKAFGNQPGKAGRSLRRNGPSREQMETQASLPDISTLPLIADFFGISMDYLFFGKEAEGKDVAASKSVPNECQLPFADDGVLRVVQYHGKRLLQAANLANATYIPLCIPEWPENTNVSIEVWGSISAEGDINGSVKAGENIECCNINGNDAAGGYISCEDISGSASAGRDLECGDISGNVTAGKDLSCNDIDGNASAGKNLSCNDVGGSASAGGDLECNDIGGHANANGTINSGSIGGNAKASVICCDSIEGSAFYQR